MKITLTLSSYLAKRYALNLLILLGALLAVIYLFDTVELIRRASKRADVPIGLILQMSILKLPKVGQTLLPFAVLFSAMFTFWQLTRKYELIVVRAAGFSIWQFLMPITAVAIIFGVMQMSIINPVSAVFIGKFEQMERKYLKHQESQIAIFKEGLWLKQDILIESDAPKTQNSDADNNNNSADNKVSPDTTTPLIKGYIILHAQKVKQPEWILKNLTILYFTDDNQFLQRIDAKSAILKDNFWQINNAVIHKNHGQPLKEKLYMLPTTLTTKDIEESFASPESMSFWKLPDYIRTLEQTGFDASSLKVYYHNLLSQPLMFCAMILLAATVSMRPPRSKDTFILITTGIFIGFIVFFLSSFLQALGASQQIPAILAAWSPALISFLLGLAVMMNLEDG